MIKKRTYKSSRFVTQANRALRQAVRKLIRERKRTGEPLIVWRRGKVVKVSADKL